MYFFSFLIVLTCGLLTITRSAIYFVFIIELNLLLPSFGLSALYLRILWNSWPSPPAHHQWSTAGVSKVQFEGRRALPLPFSLLAVYLFYVYSSQKLIPYSKDKIDWCHFFLKKRQFHKTFQHCFFVCLKLIWILDSLSKSGQAPYTVSQSVFFIMTSVSL